MARGFPYSKCPKITKQKLHGLLWTYLKSYTDYALAVYTDCFADSTDIKWVTTVSLDSGGEAIESWEECQQICEHIFKLLQFIIALIVQNRPKNIFDQKQLNPCCFEDKVAVYSFQSQIQGLVKYLEDAV